MRMPRTVRDRAGCRNERRPNGRGASPTLRAMSELPIRPYERLPAAFHPWDPRTRDVALDVARLVASARPGTVAQHVGSSSVPGMPGKNVVDLGVEADPDDIPEITDTLLSLGFQRQSGLAPFPPTRPLMLGNVDHDGDVVPRPPPRHAAGAPRAGRAARVPRRAARRPRAARRVRAVEAGVRRGRARRRRQPAVHDPQGRLRAPGRAVPPRHPHGSGRRPRARCRRARPSASWAAGSWAGCWGSRPAAMGYRMVALDPDPDCPAASVADEIVVGAYDDVEAARRLAAMADVVTYELEHVGLDAAAAAGELAPLRPGLAALRGDPRPARRAAVHPRDRGVGRAVARGPWRRRRSRRRRGARLPVAAQGADRRVRRAQPGPDRGRGRGRGRGEGARRRAGRPAAPGARDRVRGRAVRGLRARPRGPLAGVPRLAQRPRRGRAGRERRARSDPPAGGRRRARDRRLARPRARPRRAADRRAVPAAGRRADDQRARAAGAQLRSLDDRRAP